MLLILEGPDGGGKSTLVEWLRNEYSRVFTKVHATHHGPYPYSTNPSMKYLSSMRRRQHSGSFNELVILDRSWISEPIYGKVLRGGANRISTASRRMLERVAFKAGVFVIICLPPIETVKTNWAKNKGKELIQAPEYLERVYKMYDEISLDLPHAFMNYETTNGDSKVFIRDIIDQMKRYKPPAAGIGYWSENSTLIVGKGDGIVDLPFVNFSRGSISTDITDALEAKGVAESSLYWVDPTNLAPDFMGRGDAPNANIVALGQPGIAWCMAAGLKFEPYPTLESFVRSYT